MNESSREATALWVCRLGPVPYGEGVEIQERVAARRRAEQIPDTLLLLEHPPVCTRGRRSKDGELTLGEDCYPNHVIAMLPAAPRTGSCRGARPSTATRESSSCPPIAAVACPTAGRASSSATRSWRSA